MLSTERLLLRAWEEADADDLYTYARDPRVGPIAGWPPHTSPENSREILKSILIAPESYAIVLKETGRVIGSIGLRTGDATDLTDAPDECELGYWLGVPFWGKGYMPEAVRVLLRHAFDDLGMKKVWCGYYAGNERSRRVQEKCGFRFHHASERLWVPQMNEYRTGYVSVLTKDDRLAETSR